MFEANFPAQRAFRFYKGTEVPPTLSFERALGQPPGSCQPEEPGTVYQGESVQSPAATAVTRSSVRNSERGALLGRGACTSAYRAVCRIWLQGTANKVNSAAIKRISSFHQEELGCLRRLSALYGTAAVSPLPGFLQRRQFRNATGSTGAGQLSLLPRRRPWEMETTRLYEAQPLTNPAGSCE